MESGKVVRVDSTVTVALMHEPSDSSLLWDCVRVMVRLLDAADALGSTIPWHDHCRAAKKRARLIQFVRGRPKRIKRYRELLTITHKTLAYLNQAAAQLPLAAGPAGELWQAVVCNYRPLIERIITQTERRVLAGEAVPASEKLVSLFEPHADIIVKGSRDVQYGHKLNLTSGRSGLILDLVIEAGNPADSERLLPMLERHIGIWGEAPQQAAADGGYASHDNLRQAKELGMQRHGLPQKGRPQASKTWSKAAGSTASSETSAPASRPASPASSGPMVWDAAPGAGSTTSRLTSGPQWWLTTSPSSRISGQPDIPFDQVCSKQYRQLSYQELAFHLEDSLVSSLARLPWSWSQQKSVLQETIARSGRDLGSRSIGLAIECSASEAGRRRGVRLDST